MKWTVELQLVLIEDGLDGDRIRDQMNGYFEGQEGVRIESIWNNSAVESVGGYFDTEAATPGQALDLALKRLRRAVEELGIPAGPLDEAAVLQPGAERW